MVYAFDLDGTLCSEFCGGYEKAKPWYNRIKRVNELYAQGHRIIIYTARGAETGINWKKLTKMQLKMWGVLYHELSFKKPYFDLLIDNRAINSEKYFFWEW